MSTAIAPIANTGDTSTTVSQNVQGGNSGSTGYGAAVDIQTSTGPISVTSQTPGAANSIQGITSQGLSSIFASAGGAMQTASGLAQTAAQASEQAGNSTTLQKQNAAVSFGLIAAVAIVAYFIFRR
jgi:hypothetical protein